MNILPVTNWVELKDVLRIYNIAGNVRSFDIDIPQHDTFSLHGKDLSQHFGVKDNILWKGLKLQETMWPADIPCTLTLRLWLLTANKNFNCQYFHLSTRFGINFRLTLR